MAKYLLDINDTDHAAIKRAAKANGISMKDMFLEGAKLRSVASLEQLQRIAPLVAKLDAALYEIVGNKTAREER